MYADGEIKGPGTVVTVLFSVVLAATSLTQISPFATSFANAISAAQTLFAAIDRPSSINPLDEGGEKPDVLGNITFSGVGFSYPTRPDVLVLKSFSLTVPAKKTTALVGSSGSGKSTCIGLLERWYNMDAGDITIDGRPISTFNLAWLRTKMRLVQQEPVLFNGTVFENVAYGLVGSEWEHSSKDVQMAQVIEACKLANADGFINALPEAYDTHVGERAGLLSGGQKQRIAIARAVVSNPSILLLDEATSALDPHAEREVQKALDKAAVNRTTIVIAHKLTTICHADNIVVMSAGEIVEQGNHQALLAQRGVYSRLVEAQGLEAKVQEESEELDAQDEKVDVIVDEEKGLLTRVHTTRSVVTEDAELARQQAQLDYDTHKRHGILWVIGTTIKQQREMWPLFGIIFTACFAGAAIYPVQAVILARLTDVFNYTGPELTQKGDFYSLMFFVFALGTGIVYFILGWFSNVASQKLTHFYRRQMFDSLLKQDIQFFDRPENTTGALSSKLTSYPTHLQELWGFNLSLILIVLVNITASSALALAYGWKLALVVIFGGLPLLIGSGFVRMKVDHKLNEDTDKRFAESAALAAEAVGAIRTVSSLALERTILRRYQEKVDKIVRVSLPSIAVAMLFFALSQSLEFLVLALGFWYGSQLIAAGEYDMYQFFIVFVGVFLSGQGAGQFFMYSTSITKAASAGNYITWLKELQPIVAETASNKDNAPPSGANQLELHNVRFRYPTRPTSQVLRGIDLHIPPGAFIALVGGSGCGKSTLIGLFCRFYDPTTGTLTLGPFRTPIHTLNPRLYRADLALVQQEPTLYAGTIHENIALGLPLASDATTARIEAACLAANIWDFVSSLPSGLDTLCGAGGIALSGGQRQRIAIARALVRKPKILLLDESTSALDTENERIVQRAILEAAREEERITVAVAHRLSTVKDADCIYVFEGGKVREMGTHGELVARGGLYYEMCQAQSLEGLDGGEREMEMEGEK